MRAALFTIAMLIATPCLGAERLAVLELYNTAGIEQSVADYLTDRVRAAALDAAGDRLKVLTRENLLALLPPGADLSDCAGADCEVETGRRLGAGFVVSGELVKVGASLKASLKLHATGDGTLLSAEVASAADVEGLDGAMAQPVRRLMAPIVTRLPVAGPLAEPIALPSIPPLDPAHGLTGAAFGDVDTALLDALQFALRAEANDHATAIERARRWDAVVRHAAGDRRSHAAERAERWRTRARAEASRERAAREAFARKRADEAKLAKLLAYDDAVASPAQKARWQAAFDQTYAPWAADFARLVGEVRWIAMKGAADFEWEGHDGPIDLAPFAIARTEVTVAQYAACVAAGACRAVEWRRCTMGAVLSRGGDIESRFVGPDQPVVCVPHVDAEAFARFVGGRLPTAAEWMYAARGGESRDGFPWGTAPPTCKRANFMSEAGYGCGRRATAPVCSFPDGHSRHGLCDMAGNAAEWLAAPDTAPGPSPFPAHAGRIPAIGGSIIHATPDPRVIDHLDPKSRLPYLGFRVVRDGAR